MFKDLKGIIVVGLISFLTTLMTFGLAQGFSQSSK